MYRFIDLYLKQWVTDPSRKPLLLRGARQVGKTFAVRALGKTFTKFVEINCEELEHDCELVFAKDLNPERIIKELSLVAGQTIVPGETLLFLDEIQVIPRVILALRYLYEKMPELHVIAAGSLLEFSLESIGVPVGRIDSFYMYPMTWLEFLMAKKEKLLFDEIMSQELDEPISEVAHNKLLGLLGEYFALGGMPEIVQAWIERNDPHLCFKMQQSLLDQYRQDFEKYAKKHQVKYVEILFEQVPRQLGQKFKFSSIPGEFRKRDLRPCFELLVKANVIHPVYHTSAQGLPLGADADLDKFKVLFLDIGLAQGMMGLDLKEWMLNPQQAFTNQGAIVEAFVGQEILAYSHAFEKKMIYYWQQETRASKAEVDYIVQINSGIIPIEAKSGKTGRLKSIREYLLSHPNTPYCIRFSGQNYSEYEGLQSYPLYAIAKAIKIDWIHSKAESL
jgi:predicted AAA+ superfamily ATPase